MRKIQVRKSLWVRVCSGILALSIALTIGSTLKVPFGEIDRLGMASAQPTVVIRQVDPAAIAAQIYATYPDFPLENTYIQSNTGEVAIEDTLVSRLIRYHLYRANRPANFRLDWKLTIADYLDAFTRMRAARYPSADELSVNPMVGDKAAVQAMTRQQRNQLVQILFDLFTGRQPLDSNEPESAAFIPDEN